MKTEEQPGTIAVSALHGRPSRSADAARLGQIEEDLQLSVRERMLKALDLGLTSAPHPESESDSKRNAP